MITFIKFIEGTPVGQTGIYSTIEEAAKKVKEAGQVANPDYNPSANDTK